MLSHAFRIVLVGALGLGGLAQAQVKVEDAWVRATSMHQKATGAFMRLTAAHDLRLVGVRSPAAGIAEVHEMKMEGDVMQMRPLPSLDLPAGKAVELKPGGLHIMLQDLRQPVHAGTQVRLELELQDKNGARQTQQVEVPVRALGGAMPANHGTMQKSK